MSEHSVPVQGSAAEAAPGPVHDAPGSTAAAQPGMSRETRLGWIAGAVIVVVVALFPIYLGGFWMTVGLFAMAAAIGAMGLNLLVGNTGQLSLAHAFFLAVGAYSYSFFSGQPAATGGGVEVKGLGLPPLLGLVLAVLVAGVCGLIFSPVAGRLRGIYLGVASLSLVFLGQHILFNAQTFTGGFYGRPAPNFSLFGFDFVNSSSDSYLAIAGVVFNKQERLWYLYLVLTILAFLFARNLVRSRPGRAMGMIRDGEVAASVIGVPIRRYKAGAFVISSMYAGLAGVLLGLAFGRPVPDSFGLVLSVSYLAMIVIGGLGSVAGATIGGIFVSALPTVLTQYSSSIPLLNRASADSFFSGAIIAPLIYGALIILMVMLEPGGIAALVRRAVAPLTRPRNGPTAPPPATSTDGPTRDRQLEGKTA